MEPPFWQPVAIMLYAMTHFCAYALISPFRFCLTICARLRHRANVFLSVGAPPASEEHRGPAG